MSDYCINATGDCCVGDEIKFKRAIFSGSYFNPKFKGHIEVEGIIIKDSYGEEKQQHTFTISLNDGKKTRIKGRNLYKNEVYRKKWLDENERKKVLAEKHERGKQARKERDIRRATY